MFATLYRRSIRDIRVPTKDWVFAAHHLRVSKDALLVRSCSSGICGNVSEKSYNVYSCSSGVCENAPEKSYPVSSCSSGVGENTPEKSYAISYLINTCGLSAKNATSTSTKLCFTSPEKPDAVLELLREYGFADADISRLVMKWPQVLLACPKNNLSPKLKFFHSIGVPLPVLAHKLSLYPYVLWCSLKNSIIPSYSYLKTLLKSDERVVVVFSRSPKVFEKCYAERHFFSVLRERGVPNSSIVTLVMYQPSLMLIPKVKLGAFVDQALAMGFDISERGFVEAIRVFFNFSDSTLKHKMQVYRRFGWSESDIKTAFLRRPLCMSISEKKITANMEFLFDELGCKPADVARFPDLLTYSLENRIKPRCLVARFLNEKGLKNLTSPASLLKISEAEFLKNYIVKYEKDVPELSNIYLSRKVESP